jgi:hypothetical protein
VKTRTRLAVAAALLLFTGACSALLPAAPYDPAFDAGMVDFQKDVTAFFNEVAACNGTGRGTHSAFSDDYRSFGNRMAALRGQAARHARNDSTLRALDLLRENFDKVEAMHREGLIPEEVDVLRTLVDTQLRLLVQLERAKRGSAAEGP